MRLAATTSFTPRKVNQAPQFARTSPITRPARNMSDFSPLQQFQKQFTDVDKLFLKLRQTNPPSDFQQLFDDFSELKTKYLVFIDSCNKISRHIKLGNNPKKISEKPYDVCSAFPGETSRFFSYFMHLNSKISRFFIQSFQHYFSIMETCFREYAELCLREQQTRYIYLQFETTIQELFAASQRGLNAMLPNFYEIQDASSIVEILKMLSRKFETELPHALHNQRLMQTEGNEYITQFHICFVSIVPMLANIPTFNQIFSEISDSIDPTQELIGNLLREIKIETPHILTTREIRNSLNSEDLFHITPTEHFIKEIAAIFGASDGSSLQQLDWFDEIKSKARNRISKLKQKNHQLRTKLKSFDQIKSEKVLNERIEENRKFKQDLSQEFEEKRIELMRNVVNSIKVLVPYDLLTASDDFDTQMKCIVSNAELEQKVTKENLCDAKETIDQTRQILTSFLSSQFYINVDRNQNLQSLAELAVEKFSKQQRKAEKKLSDTTPSNSELNQYLKKFISKHPKMSKENLTTSQMKKELKKYSSNLEFKLNETEQNLLSLREVSSDFEDKTIENLAKVQRRLALFNQKEPLVSDITFDSLSSSVFSLLDDTETFYQNYSAFRRLLSSFLAQMLHALQLQQPKFREITDDQLKDVMTIILDSRQIQKKLGNSESSQNSVRRTPKNTRNSSNTGLNPAVGQVRPSSKEADSQFVLKMHAYLSDCCAQLRGTAPIQFLHNPIEKLMTDITKAIYEKNECLLNYKGLVSDIYIRLNSSNTNNTNNNNANNNNNNTNSNNTNSNNTNSNNTNSNNINNNNKRTKENLMKAEIGDAACGIFESIEEILSKNDRKIKNKLPELLNLIPIEDLNQFTKMKYKPLQMIRGELEKVHNSIEIISPIIQMSDELSKDLDKSRIGFVPVSPYFRHYLEVVENLRRAAIRISPQETLPTVYLIVTKMISMIDSFSNALSAVSTNENLTDGQMKAFELICKRKELDDQIEKLKKLVAEKEEEIARVKGMFTEFLAANRSKWDEQIKTITEIHQKEISSIVEFYERKNDF